MVNNTPEQLDALFAALADRTRREMLLTLGRGPSTVGSLAEPFDMSLAAVSKHLSVLERAGLVERKRQGRETHCRLLPDGVHTVRDWIEEHEAFWQQRLDALDQLMRDRKKDKQATGSSGKKKEK